MDMQINFPNLGIFLEHVGKNFSVFGLEIAFYGCTMATGIIAGYLLAAREAKRTGQNPDDYLDMLLYAVFFAIIGARIYYVIFSWDYYKDNLLSILNLRQGGLAIYGGLIGAILVGTLVVKINKMINIFYAIIPVAKFGTFHYNVRYTKTCVCGKWMLF